MNSRLRHITFTLICVFFGGSAASAQWAESDWRHLGTQEGFPGYEVGHDIVQDALGRVWMTYENGLHCFDGHDLRRYTQDLTSKSGLPEDNVRDMFIDESQRIWISTMEQGLVLYDPFKDAFEHIAPASQGGGLPVARIWDILGDSDGSMWLASRNGLVHMDPQDRSYSHHTFSVPGYTDSQLSYFNIIRSVIQDPTDSERLYCGTRGGLISFSKSQKVFTRIPIPLEGLTQLEPITNEYMIMDMHYADDAVIWMATWAGGILSYNTLTGSWRQFRDERLADENEVIRNILPRDERSYWFAAVYDAGIFDIETGEFIYANYTDQVDYKGLRRCNDLLFTPDSTLLVHAQQGLFINNNQPGYNPDKEGFAPFLTEIRINDQWVVRDTATPYLQQVALNQEENDLAFKIAWPVYREPDNVEYQFKLVGEDRDWKDNGSSRVIQYTNLTGGTYDLQYRVRRPDGRWIEGAAPLQIRIHVPFWQTRTFVIGGVLIAGLILYLLYRFRIKQIKDKQQLQTAFEKRLATQEMATLRAQMNPHFIFNSLNAIKTYILKENTEEASIYLTKFSQLMRAVLRNSADPLVSLEDEIKTLRLYIELESIRFTNKFDYDFDLAEGINTDQIMVPPLLIQPYVENAIRHGLLPKKEGTRELSISIDSQNGDTLIFSVVDNGIGRKKASEKAQLKDRNRKSYGMQITRDRIELIHETLDIAADVEIEDLHDPAGHPAGTKVLVRIPITTVTTSFDTENEPL